MSMKPQTQQAIAEFVGTFFLVFMGCGFLVFSELNPDVASAATPLVFGGTVAIMIYAVGHISGAHLNPAVTLAFFFAKQINAKKLGVYIFSQFAGAILASSLHFFFWGTDHSFGLSYAEGTVGFIFGVEVLLSFLLMFVITAVATDARAVGELAGLAIGTTVAICALVGGPMSGASMNPARSLGPALLSGHFSLLWVYLSAPLIGACLGAWVYEKIRCENPAGDETHGCC
ncbi:MAG: aquaporin [Pseudomonadota bacterium]